MMLRVLALGSMVLAMGYSLARAEPPDILKVNVTPSDEAYSFSVTIAHPDTGWDHYADAFQVYSPEGEMLGERVLLHPHEDEQPFTRSLTGVIIPEGIISVEIRARDNLGEFSEENPVVPLPGR